MKCEICCECEICVNKTCDEYKRKMDIPNIVDEMKSLKTCPQCQKIKNRKGYSRYQLKKRGYPCKDYLAVITIPSYCEEDFKKQLDSLKGTYELEMWKEMS